MSLLLGALLLAIPSALFVEGSRSSDAPTAVWRVYADGRLERVPGEFDSLGGDLWRGTTDPVPSPDQRWLAFLSAGQIRVRDLDTAQERAVTALDDPQSRYRLKITAWSPDGETLLYHVSPPVPPPTGDCTGPPEWDNPHEFRVFHLRSGEDRRLEVPPRQGVRAFLPDGSLLLEDLARPGRTWVKWKPGEGSGQRLGLPGFCGPVAPQARKVFLAACSDGDGSDRIYSIRLADGALEPVTPAEAWGSMSWPTLSPSGRMAFVQSRRTAGGDIDLARLVVDERPVFSCSEKLNRPVWIGDEALALRCRDELVVVGADDGAVRSRTAVH